jgi:hypothetical protein
MNEKERLLRVVLDKHGEAYVISMIMEQMRLLADKDTPDEVRHTVAQALNGYESDVCYIYDLCEVTNMMTYISKDGPKLT